MISAVRRSAVSGAARRFLTTSTAVAVTLCSVIGVTALVSAPAPAAAAGTSSEVTVSGKGDFASLKVTVSQTRNLVNQVVKVSWKGAAQTVSPSDYSANYLQIMQCWGDGGGGPDPRQCQFGGSSDFGSGAGGQTAGAFTNSRQLSYGSGLKDPGQELPPPSPTGLSFMPFRSVSGDVFSTPGSNDFFDGNTTNEVPYARSGPSGRGEVWFEAQTGMEAPGLGCGEKVDGSSTVGRKCWLVVVPRNDKEVDGTSYTTQSGGMLQSSPLSASNWKHRLVVPLQFERIGTFCPLGAQERATLGSELVREAVERWQPAMCTEAGRTIYSYSSVTDDTARGQLTQGEEQSLVFFGRPPARGTVPADRRPVYAPVSLSGLAFGFFIESQAGFDAPAEVKARNGTRLRSLNLTARLVAKLLTESYQDGNSRLAESTRKNPFNLGHDPEFLKHNPDYKDLLFVGTLGDALVSQPVSDATWALWEWVKSDPAAAEFLAGTPDNEGGHGDPAFSGMKLNPAYEGMTLPRSEFPKSDPFCQQFEDHPDQPLCIQDKRPYAGDLHVAARAAARGDTLARTAWDPTSTPPGYKKDPLQPAGRRAMLALTDSATAARYGLVTARLQNAAGEFVAPDNRGLLAAQAAMKPSGVPGFLVADPTTRSRAAYPLTQLVYAATVPELLDRKAAGEYAALLRYGVGDGQIPGVAAGTLPEGYAPLPGALRTQTREAADAIVRRAGAKAPTEPTTGGDSSGGNGGPGGDSGGTGGGDPAGGTGPGGGPAGGAGDPSTSPSATESAASGGPFGNPSTTPAAAAGSPLLRTPAWALGAVRYALLIALVAGLAAAVCGPLLPRAVPRLALAVTDRRRDRQSPVRKR